MVRREGEVAASAGTSPRCASPAGEGPAPVSAEAPGSRPRTGGEIPTSQAGCRKPAERRESGSREQARGPQHEVKPAASTEEQWEGRAVHVTAKARPGRPVSDGSQGLPGVGGAARVQGGERNTGDPSAQPRSGRGGSYK